MQNYKKLWNKVYNSDKIPLVIDIVAAAGIIQEVTFNPDIKKTHKFYVIYVPFYKSYKKRFIVLMHELGHLLYIKNNKLIVRKKMVDHYLTNKNALKILKFFGCTISRKEYFRIARGKFDF